MTNDPPAVLDRIPLSPCNLVVFSSPDPPSYRLFKVGDALSLAAASPEDRDTLLGDARTLYRGISDAEGGPACPNEGRDSGGLVDAEAKYSEMLLGVTPSDEDDADNAGKLPSTAEAVLPLPERHEPAWLVFLAIAFPPLFIFEESGTVMLSRCLPQHSSRRPAR